MISLLQLSYFKQLAETCNLTKTAEKIMISPPSLSAMISRLESEIGYPLFDRVGRNLKLNHNGKIMLQCANDIFSSIESARSNMRNAQDETNTHFTIGTTSSIFFTSIFKRFVVAHPEITISKLLLDSEQLNDRFLSSKASFILAPTGSLSEKDWNSTILTKDNPPCLVVYPDHPFASYRKINLSEAKNERFIALTRNHVFREYFDSLFKQAGFTPNIVLECDYLLRSTMLASGYGITISTKVFADTIELGGASFIEIENPHSNYPHSLYWSKSLEETEEVSNLVNFLKEMY